LVVDLLRMYVLLGFDDILLWEALKERWVMISDTDHPHHGPVRSGVALRPVRGPRGWQEDPGSNLQPGETGEDEGSGSQ
jgi:hypothetical protein